MTSANALTEGQKREKRQSIDRLKNVSSAELPFILASSSAGDKEVSQLHCQGFQSDAAQCRSSCLPVPVSAVTG